ncbi:Leucyl aminopeptidase [Yersinia kristensenii ATCC 33638]|nr:Leucyl aminopeptidase [Yersinia kristensenii ATCC 33638]
MPGTAEFSLGVLGCSEYIGAGAVVDSTNISADRIFVIISSSSSARTDNDISGVNAMDIGSSNCINNVLMATARMSNLFEWKPFIVNSKFRF